ncbi:MAG: hypothetical protein ACYTHK_13755 [Planctomycetota bacterium]|jgi:hypothetical protein
MRKFISLLLPLLVACGGGGEAASSDRQNQVPRPPAPSTSYSLLPEHQGNWQQFSASLSDSTTLLAAGYAEDATFEMEDGTTRTLVLSGRGGTHLGRLDGEGKMQWLLDFRSRSWCGPIAMDSLADGSVVLAIQFTNDLTLPQRGGGPDETFGAPNGVVLTRYSQLGERLWATLAVDGLYIEINELSAWGDGSCAICGQVRRDDVTFGPGTAGETTVALGVDDNFEYTARYDAAGTLVWLRRLADGGQSENWSCDTLADGSLLVTGSHVDPIRIGSTDLSSDFGAYLLRLDASGGLSWVREFASTGWVHVGAVRKLTDGRITVAGSAFRDLTIVDRSSPVSGGRFGFLAYLDADGSLQQMRTFRDTNYLGWLRLLELRDGGLALAGVGRATVDFGDGLTLDGLDPSTLYHFVVRMDEQGEIVWARADGNGSDVRLYSLIEQPNGAIALSGSYRRTYAVDLGTPEEQSTPVIDGNVYRHFHTQFHDDGAFGTR